MRKLTDMSIFLLTISRNTVDINVSINLEGSVAKRIANEIIFLPPLPQLVVAIVVASYIQKA